MYEPTIITWLILIFGLITCMPLLFVQFVMVTNPHGNKAKDLLIGIGENWRDNSHFKSQYSLAITDWLIFAPLFLLSITGIFLNEFWGYLLLSVSGAIQLYINIFLFFFEKEYVFPSKGAIKYYTYYWGNFIYWGIASLLYGIFRIGGYNF